MGNGHEMEGHVEEAYILIWVLDGRQDTGRDFFQHPPLVADGREILSVRCVKEVAENFVLNRRLEQHCRCRVRYLIQLLQVLSVEVNNPYIHFFQPRLERLLGVAEDKQLERI